MTDRSPLETLILARDYLDSLLADTLPLWATEPMYGGPEGLTAITAGSVIVVGSTLAPADATLIVALHATAPAIRELLNDAVSRFPVYSSNADPLALAILSTSHAQAWLTDREAK